MADYFTEWRLHHAEENRDITNRARHRPSGVLLMTDRNDAVLRNQPERRLQTKNVFHRGWSCDRTVGLRSNRGCAQIRRRARSGTGARAPRRVIQIVSVLRVTATRAP